ncbi:MAG: tRNA (5-methylaminomethyl-2-thiouridine)(34)-methyltransferase MnmD [Chitinophagaceae bacterium]|nr:tRNA (5-methylaminomethyl-2-thiouridine)(34)-methyltransferase MnmD [Chitinophagaceae bacterium]
MRREPVITNDGSHTIKVEGTELTFHSHHGAIGESRHVYIDAGLKACTHPAPRVFELGFGTGLNALLTAIYANERKIPVHYFSAEAFPLEPDITAHLNYAAQLPESGNLFTLIHEAPWNEDVTITPFFKLHKMKAAWADLVLPTDINLIFWDAFAPTVQPELWTTAVFEKMYAATSPSGILVTYSSKSDVRRAMQAAGFRVEKIPGPWGKRDMVRAVKMG